MSYGLCCLSLHKPGMRTMTWSRFTKLTQVESTEHALDCLSKVIVSNAESTERLIWYCAERGYHYRVSSSIFPCVTHPDFPVKDLTKMPRWSDVVFILGNAGRAAKAHDVRLSTHPGQFTVLASTNERAVAMSIRDMELHGMLMDMLGTPQDYSAPINIHINKSGDPQSIAELFRSRVAQLTPAARDRLVLENEDKGTWTVEALRKYLPEFPVTFDNLHYKCNPGTISFDVAFNASFESWPCKPLFHYSESKPGGKARAHADFPTAIPPSSTVDWDIELKAKDDAIESLKTIPSFVS